MSLLRLRVLLSSFLVKVGRFFRGNPGAVLIVGFQALIVACAVLMALRMGSVAENVAVWAYFLLVGGVVLQLVWFWRRGSDGD